MTDKAINLNQQLNGIEQLFASGQIKKAQKDLRKLNSLFSKDKPVPSRFRHKFQRLNFTAKEYDDWAEFATSDKRTELITAVNTLATKSLEPRKLANEINGYSLIHLAKTCKELDALFVHYSTDYVFNGENGPYTIYDTVSPINKYGLSKLNGEILTARNSDNYIILRANVIFDINSRASFLSWVLNSIKSQNEISVVNDQIGNPLSTVDLADFIFQSISNNYNGTFHVGSKDYKSRFEFAQLIAEIWRVDKNLILPISTLELKNKVKSYIAPRPLKSGLLVSQEFNAVSLEESILKIKPL